MSENTGSFGITVLDDRVSGPAPGGVNVLIGGPGTGKTVAALHFLEEGVSQGGRVVHLTQARPEDVIELARSIGIEVSEHIASGRWVILGYQPGFRERYRRTIEPAEVFEELGFFLDETGEPDRLGFPDLDSLYLYLSSLTERAIKADQSNSDPPGDS